MTSIDHSFIKLKSFARVAHATIQRLASTLIENGVGLH
jgi:hypothetical protein